jgi:hypothetical protein
VTEPLVGLVLLVAGCAMVWRHAHLAVILAWVREEVRRRAGRPVRHHGRLRAGDTERFLAVTLGVLLAALGGVTLLAWLIRAGGSA